MEEKKDCIIGGIDNYKWEDIRPWVRSARDTGFEGDIIVVATNINQEEALRISEKGVIVQIYGNQDEAGWFRPAQDFAPHVARFFYMWNVLYRLTDNYNYVLATDTRDVIFQRDPMKYLAFQGGRLVASSEAMRYQNEPWNAQNYQQCFGPVLFNQVKDKFIYNVGVIGGETKLVRDMLLSVFTMSINRPIKVVDQAVYNFILAQEYTRATIDKAENTHGWAIQLGTTEEAVKAGSGDIGQRAKYDASYMEHYYEVYEDVQPYIDPEGMVRIGEEDERYFIVHQWDRIPSLKEKILEKYKDA